MSGKRSGKRVKNGDNYFLSMDNRATKLVLSAGHNDLMLNISSDRKVIVVPKIHTLRIHNNQAALEARHSRDEEVKVRGKGGDENPERPEVTTMRWMLITLYIGTVFGSCEALKARLRSSVALLCKLPPGTYDIEDLMVYWQWKRHGGDVFVVGLINGEEYTQTQDEQYRGRASLEPSKVANGDFTLHLSGLQLRDSGTYDCKVFQDHSSVMLLHESSEELQVTAEYSTPVITTGSSDGTLTCTSQGGTPRPEVRWINAGDGTPIHGAQIHNNIDQDEDFVNVTSSIAINVTTNLSCVIITASGNLTSDPYELDVTDGGPGAGKHEGVAPGVRNSIIAVVVVLVIAALVAIVVVKRQFFPLTGCSRRVAYQNGKAEVRELQPGENIAGLS